jgi:hypothetical protein
MPFLQRANAPSGFTSLSNHDHGLTEEKAT